MLITFIILIELIIFIIPIIFIFLIILAMQTGKTLVTCLIPTDPKYLYCLKVSVFIMLADFLRVLWPSLSKSKFVLNN